MNNYLDRIVATMSRRRWQRLARSLASLPRTQLRPLRTEARQIQSQLSRVLRDVDSRLDQDPENPRFPPRPHNSDWAWRPGAWQTPLKPAGHAPVENRTRLSSETQIFHDCPHDGLALRQIAACTKTSLAPFAIEIEIFDFAGSFLSLAIDLPPAAIDRLGRTHLVGLHCVAESESPITAFARLNIRHGPNTEQITQNFDIQPLSTAAECTVEYDLAYSRLNERQCEKAWIDIIFETPRANRILLHDLSLARYPRANL